MNNNDGLAILAFSLLICSFFLGVCLVKASENIDIDVIVKQGSYELKRK